MALKMKGAQTAAVLGKQLGITGEGARQQLVRLGEQGLVVANSEVRGVGRPVQLWELTDAAQSRFPDTHASLTAELLAIIRSRMGDSVLEAIITAREVETGARYRSELRGINDLGGRVAALAALRSDEGYMAEWRQEPGGKFLLIENHCPICAAAAACAGFCRSEMQVFAEVLGPDVMVERKDHIIEGGRRCTYVIAPIS